MNDLTKNVLVFIVIIVVLLAVVQAMNPGGTGQPQERDYSELTNAIRGGQVGYVVIGEDKRIRWGSSKERLENFTINPETDNNTLIGDLIENNIAFTGGEKQQESFLTRLLISSFPILLLIGVWIYFMRQMQGGGGGRGAMSFGKSRRHGMLGEDQVSVTFADVAGVEEAKEEVVRDRRLPEGPGQIPAPRRQDS